MLLFLFVLKTNDVLLLLLLFVAYVMQHAANTRIGGAAGEGARRGISGGERKRLSVRGLYHYCFVADNNNNKFN